MRRSFQTYMFQLLRSFPEKGKMHPELREIYFENGHNERYFRLIIFFMFIYQIRIKVTEKAHVFVNEVLEKLFCDNEKH